ncbi:MAG: hypothetical protein IT356_01110 [Gemmatimonadaceae bacterium]|nr:hypothetical protein [Gemmatimonadaceae bacterium]
MHGHRTLGDDETLTTIGFDGGAPGVVESSWTKAGGMDDCIEIRTLGLRVLRFV